MLEGLQGVQRNPELVRIAGQYQVAQYPNQQKVKEEFLAIFYKEILKHSFKQPNFGIAGEDKESFSSVFTSDLMVGRLALELARSKSFSFKEEYLR